MTNHLIIIIMFIIIIYFHYCYYNHKGSSLNQNNSVCYKIINENEKYKNDLYYLPHTRCGIANHFFDLFQILLLSLVSKRKLKCIYIMLL